MTQMFAPGSLVRARGREWIALPSDNPEVLRLRPLSGSEEDAQAILPALERDAPTAASFAVPTAGQALATQDAASLLAEALQLALRRGAGPFRSAARIGFEPRAYQLVPLLMALRLPVARLLIADDVGIGKTIEAGLVLREMIDRGEAERFAVLCPPHLVEQWTQELAEKFDIDAVAVTSASAPRLERGLAASQTLFDVYRQTVVSLDYIKAETRRNMFARVCPGFVIVDEAHTCVGTYEGRHQRFELLRRLAEDADRHMLLLTATPHSGDEEAFGRLLGLLDPALNLQSLDDNAGRRQLARHFVQRRRIDIVGQEWGESRVFPTHKKTEIAYHFDKAHQAFHDAVLDYCLGVVERAGADQRHRRLAFWGTLALMRCVGSSPAAAASALRNRNAADQETLRENIRDDESETADAIDVEPASGLDVTDPLVALIAQAERLVEAPDPKCEAAIKALTPLVKGGANPVIFCRFIATATHVAGRLRQTFPKLAVEVVTGALTPDERRARVEAMGALDQRILVATDCLSEGVNLQSLFDMVLHYDLSWNPTRHQQREGRVDRFGQPASEVRSILLYSSDSAIDGAVLDVIINKAERIRKATGITVPLPENDDAVSGALMNAILLRKGRQLQLELDLGPEIKKNAESLDSHWRDAEENERRSRARFAQNALKPGEIIPEWQRWRDLLGGPDLVRRFVSRAMSRLDNPLEEVRPNVDRATLDGLPIGLRDRLESRGLRGAIKLSFEEPPAPGAEMVTRTHKLPSALAEALIESALDPSGSVLPSLGRAGAWPTSTVSMVTHVLLLRLRFTLTVHGRAERLLLAEEATAIAFSVASDVPVAIGQTARELLEHQASGDLALVARERLLDQARNRTTTLLSGPIADYVRTRAAELAADHASLRLAAGDKAPRVTVTPLLPADIIGLYVLLPEAR